jgi:type II secretory pathway component PulF
MNKYQAVTVPVAAINLLLMLLFPPYDYLSSTNYNVPNFDGFLFAFGDHSNRVVNHDFLSIEIFTVLINAAIAWVLLSDRARLRRRLDRQNLVLLGVALNLLLALLFPPFQDHYTGSKALLPSFDGFYFVFGDNSMRVIVPPMLWLEVIFILINGTALWLLFCQPGPRELTAAERFAQSEKQLGRPMRRTT